ncbi:MAG TPA: hypothetical protein VE242_03775 [Chthoniobacterales bacterium]|nr:hypothetical protein [Chthoniobacterales bacterium]
MISEPTELTTRWAKLPVRQSSKWLKFPRLAGLFALSILGRFTKESPFLRLPNATEEGSSA